MEIEPSKKKTSDFPHNLPADDNVEIKLNIAKVEVVTEPAEQIYCAVCTMPMSIKIRLDPCNHHLCYSCFTKYNEECKYCGFEIVDAHPSQNTL